ncbi:MAG: IS21 family transposase [bacterium]
MARLRKDAVMVAQQMVERQVPVRQVARQLGVDESSLRYRLSRPAAAPDGRQERPSVLDGWDARVDAVLARFDDARLRGEPGSHVEAAVVHGVLQRDFGFLGSYQAVRRYLTRRFPRPVQAIRRVETPPGVQAQHDWFECAARVGGVVQPVYGLIGTLSYSRASFVWVSLSTQQLAWQTGHLALFRRYGGVPLWIRIDNLKTGVASGAGSTAVLNPAFATFARTCGFGVDPCRAARGSDKGKTERNVRTSRSVYADLLVNAWGDLPALQAGLDARSALVQTQRRCPITGTSIAEALTAERARLQPVPDLQELFDCVVARRVSRDCLVSFEGRRYSVPFAWIGRQVEVRGTAQDVVVWAEGQAIARHPRHTRRTLVLEPAHYDGGSTRAVLAPTPLGRRAQLQLAARPYTALLPPPEGITRPLTQYLTLLGRAGR